MRHPHPFPTARGFTLIEAIVVIVITGILASMVAVFIRSPVDAYFDAARRAELTDTADTAMRRISRDLHLALPNSVRNAADDSDQCLEFIPTKTGGRYRAAAEAGGGDILDFTLDDNKFDMLWANSALPTANQVAVRDIIVVFNDGSAAGNAYLGKNAIRVTGLAALSGTFATSTKVTFAVAGDLPFDGKKLPSESPANRFQVIPANEHVVAYDCSSGILRRYSRILTPLTPTWPQPANCAAMIAGANVATLAINLDSTPFGAGKFCSLKYDPPGAGTGLSRYGIVSISLAMSQSGESVKLYQQVHVDNTP